MNYKPDDLVKSCRKLECGLRLGIEGIHACQPGPFSAPLFWTADEAAKIRITKEMIAEKRKQLFIMLNDEHSDIACKHCKMVKLRPYKEISFTRLGHIDLSPSTICNLRCSFCGYTMRDSFEKAKYDALAILKEFSADDVEWDSAVDFNGGEPTLFPDLDEYLEYFSSRRIRVFFYTNSVKYHQAVFNGLADGSIRWVCTSLDAGTPSTYSKLKRSDVFLKVLGNLTRYADAGSRGGGSLAVKYIFCEGNCGDDDVAGFVYAMLAIRPQEVWLTFDFEPLSGLPADSPDFCGLDYSAHIAAYVKTYKLLKQHGLTPVHFAEKHLATVSLHGKILLEKVKSEIEKTTPPEIPEMILKDFRKSSHSAGKLKPSFFSIKPLRIRKDGGEEKLWSLEGKRILIAPACQITVKLLSDVDIGKAQIAGILDRDMVLQGKMIGDVLVYGYEAIPALKPDYILLTTSEQHVEEIMIKISGYGFGTEKIVLLCQ